MRLQTFVRTQTMAMTLGQQMPRNFIYGALADAARAVPWLEQIGRPGMRRICFMHKLHRRQMLRTTLSISGNYDRSRGPVQQVDARYL